MIPKPPFKQRTDGGVDVRIGKGEREVLARIAAEMRSMLISEADPDAMQRLFPPGHPNEPELEAEYRSLVHDELLRKKLDDLDVLEETATSNKLTADQIGQWMQSLNGLRLVLGTRLDVSEESERPPDNDPTAGQYALYEYLGYLLEMLIGETLIR